MAKEIRMPKEKFPPPPPTLGTLRYPGRGGKGNGESLERGRRHLRGKNKLRLSRLGGAARLTREDKVMLSCFNSMTSFRKTREVLLD